MTLAKKCPHLDPGRIGAGIFEFQIKIRRYFCDQLAPVAFDEEPAAVAIRPMSGYPLRARMRLHNIAAWNPDVAGSVPAMVSAGPDISGMRRRAGALDDNRGRGNTNDDLRERRRRSNCASEYS